MILFLEILMIGALFFQPSQSRLFAGGVFISILILHEVIFSQSEGLTYYGSASLFYIGIMIITSPAAHVTRLVFDIHKICLAAITVNAFGWLLWFFYFQPAVYNIAYLGLHCWAIYVLMQRVRRKQDEFRIDWGHIGFRSNADVCNKYLPQYKGET